MDNSKDSGSNLGFWLPGSAIILSLVVSTFALTREPFLESRPIGGQFQAQLPIEARLWQDPFDALERYRKKLKDSKFPGSECSSTLSGKSAVPGTSPAQEAPPDIMVALVEGGPYADEVELRRRIRYATLAGFKNSRMVPEDEQHIRCLALANDLAGDPQTTETDPQRAELPYETFVADPFDPPTDVDDIQHPADRTMLFWVKQEYLGSDPLQKLEVLRHTLACKVGQAYGAPQACDAQPDSTLLKVVGPSNSTMLRDMYWQEAQGTLVPHIEIYSPLATADKKMLMRGFTKAGSPEEISAEPTRYKESMNLLRTVSDDGTMTRLLLEELKLRRVDPAAGVQCAKGATLRVGMPCGPEGRRANRIALISEWDSFYSRALIESFKSQVAESARIGHEDGALVDEWVLRFSYLRGLDGRLPEEAPSGDKATAKDASKDSNQLDLSPLEKSDGNSQLDYLRRLADYIVLEDEAYRRNGESGIGAIGVLGVDTYDKLLVLQALKSRMPNKVFFSTDLDARMLQRGQAQTTRNLVLAAPYGLTLTRALQQDVPPFRDSLQSAVFIAVLAAQAPQSFDAKRAKFDYSKSGLLSPGIYEVGISGFIPLASRLTASRAEDCAAPLRARPGRVSTIRAQDIMALRCLQDPSPPPYPELSQTVRNKFEERQSYFWAGPLSLILLVLAIFLGWWWTNEQSPDNSLPPWVRGVPLALYVASGLSAWVATQYWRVEFMWITFVLILLGIICSGLIRRSRRQSAPCEGPPAPVVARGLFDSSAWYIAVPIVAFILALLWAFQIRHTLTGGGLGEPMFLFEGISAWPTVALRLLAVLISISALAWGWRSLRVSRIEIETAYHLRPYLRSRRTSLWRQFPRFVQGAKRRTWHQWFEELGHRLFLVLFPLSSTSIARTQPRAWAALPRSGDADGRTIISFLRFWREHCVSGTFGARMLRAVLATWIFVVVTSVLFVLWPMEGVPVRGESPVWRLSWMVPTLVFQLLVFWVVDANRLLARFIRQLSSYHAIWPKKLQDEHEKIFGIRDHACIDDWVDTMLIARRSAAVNRLIYAPTVVLLILMASRSSVFDNWPTPPSVVLSFLLTALVLLISALSLRRAAEKARAAALQRVDSYLLETPASTPGYDKFRMIRERIAALNTGAFSRYSEEPLVRALLLALTGIGGSAIVDALSYAKF
ncbi:hypothetical protein [Pseudomonas fluorescens]|uniref:Uncharacterized protein n=1 Tax=Pseudomonas fluorescens TaxID=294 RepID=A0A5E7CC93_PSEFL|nr:hypothetical protein [Pseudomonas fluorescens]VVO02433.1 hypothetical protein PS691_02737 [Pseudomonas fluorescens]